MTEKHRIEKDSLGDIKVPKNALYAAQTQRAINNFNISDLTMPAQFIRALGFIKAAAAKTNAELKQLDKEIASAITTASLSIAKGEYLNQFPIDVFQTGSGTSSNMNANEVIATLASQQLNYVVHANDHVNCGQSSNDVIPTAIHISAYLSIEEDLLPAIQQLQQAMLLRENELSAHIKTGRTHLMDAMPISFAQEISAWRTQLERAKHGIKNTLQRLRQLAQGATAIGTGINAAKGFSPLFCTNISDMTGYSFTSAENLFASVSCQDTAVELSGQMKTLAVALMKIANDLRWMNSGPLAGFGEINLKPLQPGSSIMPGKVNPVIPEAVAMAASQVIGNDATITVAGQSGNFQLNVMLPVIAYNTLQSIELLANSCTSLAGTTIVDFTVNRSITEKNLARNPILITALNREIGYNKAAEIAKRAYLENRAIIDVAVDMTDYSESQLKDLLDPKHLI